MKVAWITCYFNIAGFNGLLNNFQRFRKEFPFPTISAEAYFGESPETDSEIMVKGDRKNILWQKERLLNLVIESLPAEYDIIAWVDADVHLPRLTEEMLIKQIQQTPVVQLFESMHLLDYGNVPSNQGGVSSGFVNTHKIDKVGMPGFAWAARRDLFENGLYDRQVAGGGDRLMQSTFLAEWDNPGLPINKIAAKHWLNWSWPVYAKTRKRFGYLPIHASHWWHGNRKFRFYRERHLVLTRNQFDPDRHIQIDENGLFEWTDEAPQPIVDYMSLYFAKRREDESCCN